MIWNLIAFIIAITVGLVTVIQIVPNVDLLINLMSLTFGVTALIWVIRARASLSKGSSLRKLTTKFLFVLLFILCFSVWKLYTSITSAGMPYPDMMMFGDYLFISLAYITCVGTAYHIRKMVEEFGFNVQSARIQQVIEEKKKEKKKAKK